MACIIAAGGAGGWYWWQRHLNALPAGIVMANGRIEGTEIDGDAKIPGRIADILANEGDFVHEGQLGRLSRARRGWLSTGKFKKSLLLDLGQIRAMQDSLAWGASRILAGHLPCNPIPPNSVSSPDGIENLPNELVVPRSGILACAPPSSSMPKPKRLNAPERLKRVKGWWAALSVEIRHFGNDLAAVTSELRDWRRRKFEYFVGRPGIGSISSSGARLRHLLAHFRFG